MSKIKLLLADDHVLVRQGFKALLEKNPDFEIVGEANDGKELIHLVERLRPDIVLADISMPKISGLEAIKTLTQNHPKLKFIMLTMHKEAEYIFSSMKAGASGYLLKDVEPEELEEAIYKVAEGKKHYNHEISSIVADRMHHTEIVKPITDRLTRREREILQYVADGMSTKMIADKLNISDRTVETHRIRLLKKLNVSNSVELIKIALKNHLLNTGNP